MKEILTETDDVMIPGATVNHVSSESVLRDRPNELQGRPRDFIDSTRAPNRLSRELEIVEILLIRRKEHRSVA